jgi:16S rRNA (cytidine1402-2'-O)-methyltransferase
LLASLDDAKAELGNRKAAISRELTKLHEETLRGPLADLTEQLKARPTLKGEFVIVIGGRASDEPDETEAPELGTEAETP